MSQSDKKVTKWEEFCDLGTKLENRGTKLEKVRSRWSVALALLSKATFCKHMENLESERQKSEKLEEFCDSGTKLENWGTKLEKSKI